MQRNMSKAMYANRGEGRVAPRNWSERPEYVPSPRLAVHAGLKCAVQNDVLRRRKKKRESCCAARNHYMGYHRTPRQLWGGFECA